MRKRLFTALLSLSVAGATAEALPMVTPAPTVSAQVLSATPAPLRIDLPTTAAAPSGQTVTVRNEGDVNLRRRATSASDRVGTARAGHTYPLLEIAENGWYKILLSNGVEGYISPKLVQGEPEQTSEQRVVIHKRGNVNVRQEPKASARRVGVARAGRSYPLLETDQSGWHKILLSGGVVGYVSPKVVSRVTNPGENPDATPSPVPTDTGETVLIRKAGDVNVRKTPEYASPRVGTARAGRRYPLLETAENGWYKIRLSNGVEGYVSNKLAQ